MKRLFYIIGLVLLGVAIFQFRAHAMPDPYFQHYCSNNGAYAHGVNDGLGHLSMNSNYAASCPRQWQWRLNHNYRTGYHFGLTHSRGDRHHRRHPWPGPHRAHKECIHNAFGQSACGYGCVKTMSTVRCARRPGQRCVANTVGQIACGYSCIKSMSGVRCTRFRRGNCVKDNFGNIKCGINCRSDGFSLTCDKEG